MEYKGKIDGRMRILDGCMMEYKGKQKEKKKSDQILDLIQERKVKMKVEKNAFDNPFYTQI